MKKLSDFKTAKQRRKFLEKKLRISLEKTTSSFVDEEKKVHIENLVGAVSIPLGVAGPLKIRGASLKIRNCYIPLATTEGALIASVNRGCKAITASGGATVAWEDIGVTRGSVFETGGITESKKFKRWLSEHIDVLEEKASETSSHLKLKKIEAKIVGRYVYVRFYFDTGQAMGMNMATIAADSIASTILSNSSVKLISLAGNFDIDKKPGWLNFLYGRGKRIWAEAVIEKRIVEKILKTTQNKIFEVWLSKCMLGSAISGSLGFNAHFANIVAAFFAATGQDLAHTVEGSLGVTTAKIVSRDDLYVSVYLPAIMIGLVGGGTKFATQKEALKIVGVKKVSQLAQVLAGVVLAGELSLLASLAEGSLAQAHEKLGR